MKVILTGATGVVGTECVRLALLNPAVTQVIALARRPVSLPKNLPSNVDSAKLKNVILEDFGTDYPDSVTEQMRGADACVWNLAITPKTMKGMTPEEAKRISHDFTVIGLRSIMKVANADHPFRFVYTSGAKTERDQNRSLWIIPEFRKMRGAVETAVLTEAADSKGRLEAQVQKPGAIRHSGRTFMENNFAFPLMSVTGMQILHVSEVAAAQLDQAMNGFAGKDTLEAEDILTVGQRALTKWNIPKSEF